MNGNGGGRGFRKDWKVRWRKKVSGWVGRWVGWERRGWSDGLEGKRRRARGKVGRGKEGRRDTRLEG